MCVCVFGCVGEVLLVFPCLSLSTFLFLPVRSPASVRQIHACGRVPRCVGVGVKACLSRMECVQWVCIHAATPLFADGKVLGWEVWV